MSGYCSHLYVLSKIAERKHSTCSNSDPDFNVEVSFFFLVVYLKSEAIKALVLNL
jgi:hypothetical protein